jgi:hypothetical protein
VTRQSSVPEGDLYGVIPFFILLRAHDHIWDDKTLPFNARFDAAQIVWDLVIKGINFV